MGEAKVLVNCHVFDGRSPDVRRDQYVVVRDGNIAGIQRGAGGENALRHLLSKAGLEAE